MQQQPRSHGCEDAARHGRLPAAPRPHHQLVPALRHDEGLVCRHALHARVVLEQHRRHFRRRVLHRVHERRPPRVIAALQVGTALEKLEQDIPGGLRRGQLGRQARANDRRRASPVPLLHVGAPVQQETDERALLERDGMQQRGPPHLVRGRDVGSAIQQQLHRREGRQPVARRQDQRREPVPVGLVDGRAIVEQELDEFGAIEGAVDELIPPLIELVVVHAIQVDGVAHALGESSLCRQPQRRVPLAVRLAHLHAAPQQHAHDLRQAAFYRLHQGGGARAVHVVEFVVVQGLGNPRRLAHEQGAARFD
mmetsp:Transcript_1083/g.2983  ORF Transcript_1083/g.2983 Transcript_1083/m.2983 type:complete len:309 (+) Transcript_1083:595-1521(+)